MKAALFLGTACLVTEALTGCGDSTSDGNGASCGPGTSNVDGVCVPTDSLGGTGGTAGASGGGAASSAGAAGQSGRVWKGCPVDAPGSPMVEVEMPDGTPYCIDIRPVNEADFEAFVATNPTVEGLPPEMCSSSISVTTGFLLLDTHIAMSMEWCTAYAYCAWAGKRLCGRVEGNGSGVNDNEWYNACSDRGAHAYAWGDDYRAECAYVYEYLPECASEPYGLEGIGVPPGEWTTDCEPSTWNDGTESVRCAVFDISDLEEESTCDAMVLPNVTPSSGTAAVRCCF